MRWGGDNEKQRFYLIRPSRLRKSEMLGVEESGDHPEDDTADYPRQGFIVHPLGRYARRGNCRPLACVAQA